MAIRNQQDGFDDYRRERRRQQVRMGPTGSVLGYENSALRELEQVEARETRDRQLTREVHDFFAAATKQAATIVEKVAHHAQVEAGERLEQEMESFLIDSLSRMNTFVVTALQSRRNAQVAETQMEPTVANIVGPVLDEFRWEGTAEVLDKHIGQDPFATSVEDVQRDFRAQIGEVQGVDAAAAAPIEDHLVAEVQPPADEEPAEAAAAVVEAEPAPEPGPEAAAMAAAAPAAEPELDPVQELERFKSALKALVRQGVMNRAEASAAWQARLQALGYRSPAK
ncbi:MAG: hypothetical protein IT455_21185 [Planctomycetes bacterium]|nr:hypothetical protein [Planctomycetota bacterium]